MDTRDAENTIFDLRKKADLYLQAGAVDAFNLVQDQIVELQKQTGAVKGAGKEMDNDHRIA
jgi:hypothetical protein